MKTMLRSLVIAASTLPLLTSAAEQTAGDHAASQAASTKGLPLRVPDKLRTSHAHLGTWIVPDAAAPGHGIHDVYTDADSIAAYRKTGSFPDGTLLAKEIRGIGSDTLTTGLASWATETKVWFVMVRDAKGRYKNSPLWGDGWLWALYKADDPSKNVAVSYAKDCQGCHLPAAATDRVFIQGYPSLRGR